MTVLFALLGLVVGGLVNQLGSDLPAFAVSRPGGRSIQLSPDLPRRRRLTCPHCARCGRHRPWWQWLSLPSYLIRRARCPSCDTPINLRYPLVEVGLAVVYGYLWIMFGPSVKLGLYLIYTAIFALILITDIERRLILNVVTYPAIAFALVASFFTPGMKWWSAVVGGVIGFLVFLGVEMVGDALFGSGALGAGDVKLAALVGLVTGFPLVLVAMFLGIVSGGLVAAILLLFKLKGRKDAMPFGPFLSLAAMATLFWGSDLLNWLGFS